MLLLVENVSKSFGPQILYTSATLQLNKGERWALVGPNGAGKTTFLKIILGQETSDEGGVSLAKGTTLGYLEQEIKKPTTAPALKEVLNSVTEIKDLEAQIEMAQKKLANLNLAGDQEELLKMLGEAQNRFEELGGYELESNAKQIMAGLGFSESDFLKPANAFSGGWLMRIALSKLLLKHPDVLLLDEPTNHLDLESVHWFESFLNSYSGSVLMVSHDRAFMDQVVDHVAALENRTLCTYKGNYSDYLKAREENLEQLRTKRAAQEREIAHMQVFVDKFRYKATKAKAAQERMARIEQIKENLVMLPEKTAHVHFSFPQPQRTPDLVVSLNDVEKTFDAPSLEESEKESAKKSAGRTPKNADKNTVYRDLNLKLYRGDKVALVGPNGAGKSTLMKLVAGVIEPTKGKIELGKNVSVSYYAQHQTENLEPTQTVLQEINKVAKGWTTTEERRLLGAFLFTAEDIEKKIALLSGGEKARLALAKMLVQPAPLLCLDEPTNHLDIDSVSVLEEALKKFTGTIILISHDESLVRAIANKVIDVRDGSIRVFEGDYDYYLFKRATLEANESGPEGSASKYCSEGELGDIAADPSSLPLPDSSLFASSNPESSQASPHGQFSSHPETQAFSDVTSQSRSGKVSLLQPSRRRGPKTKEQKRAEAAERNRIYQMTAVPKKRMASLEEELDRMKTRYAELMDLLADSDIYQQKEAFDAAMQEYSALAKKIPALEEEWLELSLELEEIQKAHMANSPKNPKKKQS